MTSSHKRRSCTAIVFGLLSSLALVIPTAQAQDADIVFAIGTPVLNLDPGSATDSQAMTIRYQIMEPLVQVNAETGAIEPLLAESWEVAADNRTWTFKLRPNVVFHDGTALTSADVVASISRIINPELGLGRANDLRDIESVEAVDPLTVRIVSKQPVGAFLQILALDAAAVVSAGSIEAFGADIAWHPVGTGPFRYDSHVAELSVTLVRNDDYWGAAPDIEKVTFLSVPEATTRVTMLETGEADIVINVPGNEVERLEADPDIKLLEEPNTRVAHLGINTTREPFDNVLVRQAVNFAIDRKAIIAGVLRGLGAETNSIISPMVAGYQSQDIYPYDPEKAKALLAEAGLPDGFSTTLWTPQGRYYLDRESMVAVQSMLADVGIKAEMEVIDWSSYLTMLRQPEDTSTSALYMLAWESNINDIQYILDTVFDSVRAPPDGWNTMFYSSAEADSLSAAIRAEVDQTRRAELVNEIQHQIMTDAPWVPLFSFVQVTGYRSNLSGIEYLPSDTYRLKNVVLD